ncbi:MAG: transposase [Gammaproteobacteria bacterium]|nr:transposase [Gammaproteobacteria bacterium]
MGDKAVVAKFDQRHASSDGGAILLQACDRRVGLTAALIGGIEDRRQCGKIRHAIGDLLRQRLYAIACGYPDGNDASRLAADPIQKLLGGRDPVGDEDLASQPTLSRFENAVRRADLYRMGIALADAVIERHRRRLKRKVKRITIDLDPTDDPTHARSSSRSSTATTTAGAICRWPGSSPSTTSPSNTCSPTCCVPAISLPRSVRSGSCRGCCRGCAPRSRGRGCGCDSMAVTPRPRSSRSSSARHSSTWWRWPKTQVLKRRAARLMGSARRLSRESGQTAHLYGECRYAAGTWSERRRVIIKAEVVRHPGREPKDNPRFVVTNLKHSPRHLYEAIYCARGDVENRIKELHHGLEIDRTSCTRFLANQLRGLLTAAAYVLYQELRLRVARAVFRSAQVSTRREQLCKLGAWVESSVRRIVLHLPASCLHRHDWQIIARQLGAAPA